jgi:hypothetical protein
VWVDAVEKIAEEIGEPFHLSFWASVFSSCLRFLSGGPARVA